MASIGKILIVDDNADMRGIMICMLGSSGFHVIAAEDGLIGLRIAEAERPDLIITDICMPRMDGIQMILRLRAQFEFSEVPILVITAYGSGTTEEALKAGANHAMHKPVDFNSFIGCINELLQA